MTMPQGIATKPLARLSQGVGYDVSSEKRKRLYGLPVRFEVIFSGVENVH